MAFVAVSKIIAVKFNDETDQFLVKVASDLVFEMGAALIGSVATVIFIEYQNKTSQLTRGATGNTCVDRLFSQQSKLGCC